MLEDLPDGNGASRPVKGVPGADAGHGLELADLTAHPITRRDLDSEGDMSAIGLDFADRVLPTVVPEYNPRKGMLPAKSLDEGPAEFSEEDFSTRDDELRIDFARADLVADPGLEREEILGAPEKVGAGFGQLEPLPAPQEKRGSELALEILDGLADRGRRNVESAGGGVDAVGSRDL